MKIIDNSSQLLGDDLKATLGLLDMTHLNFDTPLRRIKFRDPETRKELVFLTNNFILPALTIAELYRCRWQVELFFKWIKQHLRIKAFFGTTENAVRRKFGSQCQFMC